MSVSVSGYPDTEVLTKVLTKVLNGAAGNDGCGHSGPPRIRGSTFPVEVVPCRLPDGKSVRMFCSTRQDGVTGAMVIAVA